MKKNHIVIIVFVTLVVLLAIPNLVGGGIQNATMQTLLTMIPDEASQVLDIRQTEFQRGWFSSDAQIEITVDELEELTGEKVALILDLDILHGPLLFTPEGIRLGLAYADIDTSILGISLEDIEPAGEISSETPQASLFAGFDNSVEFTFKLDDLLASNPEAQLGITGLQGSSQIMADLSSNAALELDTLSFTIADGSFDLSIQNMAFSGSESDITQAVSTGQSSFSIAQISSTAPLPLTMNTFTAEHALNQDPAAAGFLNLTQLININELNWDMPVSSLQWQFELNHLSRQLLDNYLQLIQQSQQTAGASPSQATAQISALGEDLVLGLIRESFTFDNSFQINAFAGDHRLQLNIDWPGMAGLVDFQSVDPQQLLQTVRIRLELDADQAALMNSPFAQTVIDYQRPGFLLIDNGRVLSTIQLADGILDINGELTPLEQFINL